MYASHLAHAAYAPAATAPARPAQTTEYQAFARITSALKRARSTPDVVHALHQNRQLWTTLAVDVADPGNALPEDLRARILYLAEFTRMHTGKVLRGKADAESLIDINTAMMRGLRQQQDHVR